MWKTTTPDADVMFWWFKTHGYTHLGVAIGREGQSSPVSDAQASKILSSFLGVTEFWEIKEGPCGRSIRQCAFGAACPPT
jgi:hypothetical protein